MTKLALTMAELAQALGIDRVTVYRLLKNGTLDIPVFHIGSSARVRAVDVEAYLERLAEDARLEQTAIVARRVGRRQAV
jgi:excisionase family DNA binding protein